MPEHFHGNQLVECFKKNKFCVRMSNDTYQVVLKFLQVREHHLLHKALIASMASIFREIFLFSQVLSRFAERRDS